MTAVSLGEGGEFDRIRAIAAALGTSAEALGDDTAPVPAGKGQLVTSVDASVEDVHFRRGWLTLEEIGWRSTASALSDLAAAAATPAAVLAAVIVPQKAGEAALVEVMRGVGAASAACGAHVIGGDLTSGTRWGVIVTVMGHAERPMSRVGARAGDGVWVTGVLGGARSALQAWTTSMEPDAAARAVFAHPVARIEAAQWLRDHGATAMLDLSDGLGGDAGHLAAASKVRIDLDLDHLPLHPSVQSAARHIDEAPEMFATAAGEDYELLLTLPASFAEVAEFERVHGLRLTRIGAVSEGTGVHATLHGKERQVHGFRHAV